MGFSFGKKHKLKGIPVEDYMRLEDCPRYDDSGIVRDGHKMVFCKVCGFRTGKQCQYKNYLGI